MVISKKWSLLSLVVLVCVLSSISRFFNLTWGAPFYFHPDERNIASAVTQLAFPDNMNPHFFAYNALPIYTTYFTGVVIHFFLHASSLLSSLPLFPSSLHEISLATVSFSEAIIISRFYSACFSLFLLFFLYSLGKQLHTHTTGIIAMVLGTLSVGFIQYSHFGTFEMWLTFWSLVLFYACVIIVHKGYSYGVYLTGITLGFLIAIKISSLILVPLPFFAILLHYVQKGHTFSLLKKCTSIFILTVLVYNLSFITFFVTSPFTFFDWTSARESLTYESRVGLGSLPVFYTGEFLHSLPILYQFVKIYPFLLNPFLTCLFIPSFIYVIILMLKTKNPLYILLITSYLLMFIPQAFLFVKWTRYMVPTLPFMYIIIALAITQFIQNKKLLRITLGITFLISFIYATSYVVTAFVQRDSRESALLWAQTHIRQTAKVTSSVYDLGIVPFNNYFSPMNITLFNFYDLDNNTPESTPKSLGALLKDSDYLILPSQRMIFTRLSNKSQFPNGNRFYTELFANQTHYRKVYETPCDVFCHITYFGNPVFSFEETVNVFDRPEVFIFKNIYSTKDI